MTKRDQKIPRKRIRIFFAGTLTLASVCVGIYFARFCVLYNPIPFQVMKFDSAIKWSEFHKVGTHTAMPLPKALQNISKNGMVYFTGKYIFVPAWIGRKSILPMFDKSENNILEGYLYVPNKITYDKNAGDVSQVTVNVPLPDGTIQPSTMLVPEGSLNSRWYFVCSPDAIPI